MKKKIKLTNWVGLLIGACTIPFIFVFYIHGSRTFGGATVVNTALFFSVSYFNRRGDFNFSRHLLLFTWGFGVFIYSLYLGSSTGLQNCFFSLIAMPFILFMPSENIKFLHVFFPFLAYFLIELNLITSIDTLGLTEESSGVIRNFVNPTVLIQLVIVLYYYGSHERSLIKENKKAVLLSSSLEIQKKHLIKKSNEYEQSKGELENLLASLDDVVLEVNSDAEILTFWTQKNRENLEIGERVSKYYGLFMEKKIESAFDAFGRDYFNKVHEYSCNDKYYQFKITPLSKNLSDNDRAAVMIRDVTINKTVLEEYNEIKKEKEIAVQSAKFKESFLANMSHEIRTPLNGVVGMIDLLSDTSLDAVQKDYLNTIKLSSDNLLDLINDILDLSKIEAGKMSLQPKRFNVLRLIENTIDLFRPMGESKGLKMNLVIDSKIPKFITADPTRISQVLTNLISNAVKFTIEGSVTLKVDLKNDKELRFQIIDTGEGIPEESQTALFKKFTQLDQEGKSKIKGTGLGLSIVKELVVIMQGAISLTSEMGKGSNFSFYIHFDPAVQIEEEVSVSNNVSEVQPMKVLLVDDISVNRKVAGIMLKKLNCEFTEASNGLEALKVIDDESFDLVLMDIQMPEMDGVEALQKLKEKDSSSLPPVIALSANALEGDREKYLGLGFDDYIAKPITLKALRDHLGKVS